LNLLGQLGPVSAPLFNSLPAGVCPLFYPVLTANKPEVLDALWAQRIEAVDFWRDHHPACDPAEFPDTMQLRSSVVEIPCHQDLSEASIRDVAQVVVEVLRAHPGPRRAAARQ